MKVAFYGCNVFLRLIQCEITDFQHTLNMPLCWKRVLVVVNPCIASFFLPLNCPLFCTVVELGCFRLPERKIRISATTRTATASATTEKNQINISPSINWVRLGNEVGVTSRVAWKTVPLSAQSCTAMSWVFPG